MGEVYRARDTRLDRTGAVKVLPGHLSDDVEARQRFEREAKSISSLNHTNVCTLQDIGKHDGIDFQVMEFLEGETLADRLTRGPLPTAAGGPVMVLADAPNPRGTWNQSNVMVYEPDCRDTLWQVRALGGNAKRLTLTNLESGDPIPLANSVQYDMTTWHTTFTVSQNGVLVYEPGSRMQGSDLMWMDRNGKTPGEVGGRDFYKGSGRLSPDGKKLAASIGDPPGRRLGGRSR